MEFSLNGYLQIAHTTTSVVISTAFISIAFLNHKSYYLCNLIYTNFLIICCFKFDF